MWLTCDHPIWAHTMGIYFISKMAKHFISSLVLRHTCYGFCPLHSSIHTPHDLFTSHRLYSYPPLMLLNTVGWKWVRKRYRDNLLCKYYILLISYVCTIADSRFSLASWYQGGVKSAVSRVFQDLKFKISEGSDQNWCFPGSAQLAVSV